MRGSAGRGAVDGRGLAKYTHLSHSGRDVLLVNLLQCRHRITLQSE